MTKLGEHIVAYLQENKTLNLEGIGSFYKDDNADVVENSNKDLVYAFKLEQNNNAYTDAAFIDFIRERTGKMKPLVIADVESYLNTGKQLLNISKPFTIEGLGSINRDSYGKLSFQMGAFMPPKIDVSSERERKSKITKEKITNELNYETTYGKTVEPSKKIGKKVLGALAFTALIGGIGYFLYAFLFNNNSENTKIASTKATVSTTPIKDTSKPVANVNTSVPDSLGRLLFKIVVRTTDEASAKKRANQFETSRMPSGYDTTTVEKEATSANYKVIVHMRSKVADTAVMYKLLNTQYGTTGQTAYFVQ